MWLLEETTCFVRVTVCLGGDEGGIQGQSGRRGSGGGWAWVGVPTGCHADWGWVWRRAGAGLSFLLVRWLRSRVALASGAPLWVAGTGWIPGADRVERGLGRGSLRHPPKSPKINHLKGEVWKLVSDFCRGLRFSRRVKCEGPALGRAAVRSVNSIIRD